MDLKALTLFRIIRWLMTTIEVLRQQMSGNGRLAVLEKYSWEEEGQKLLALYEELIE